MKLGAISREISAKTFTTFHAKFYISKLLKNCYKVVCLNRRIDKTSKI
jgi:hypothetical protein